MVSKAAIDGINPLQAKTAPGGNRS